MASIPLVSGGSQPVFAIDTRNGPVSGSTYLANVPTNFAGPALEFYQIGNLTGIQNQAQVNGAIQYIDIALQQVCTIAIQQANANSLSIATYPLGAFGANASTSATALQAIVQALGANVGGTGLNASGAAVTNLGFKLSAT